MRRLTGIIKNYAWGSRDHLATMAGRPVPGDRPEAELWLGAHPAGPSLLDTGLTLAEHIAADPEKALGPATVARFGPKLPYLLKLIAVAEPLSLQIHPSAEQAVDGHARGVYGDPRPKPELVCALTPFTALAGFRPAGESAELLRALRTPQTAALADLLVRERTADAVEEWLSNPQEFTESLDVAVALDGPEYRLVGQLAEKYPGDVSCLAPLFLKRHDLAPGDALFLDAGVLHCYLSGLAVEVMAASDNVVRAGLTPKPVDIPELLRILNASTVPQPVRAGGDGFFPASSPWFRLRRTRPGEHLTLNSGTPRIVLCTEGEIRIGPSLVLGPATAAFIDAVSPLIEMAGEGVAFIVEPGTLQ